MLPGNNQKRSARSARIKFPKENEGRLKVEDLEKHKNFERGKQDEENFNDSILLPLRRITSL